MFLDYHSQKPSPPPLLARISGSWSSRTSGGPSLETTVLSHCRASHSWAPPLWKKKRRRFRSFILSQGNLGPLLKRIWNQDLFWLTLKQDEVEQLFVFKVRTETFIFLGEIHKLEAHNSPAAQVRNGKVWALQMYWASSHRSPCQHRQTLRACGSSHDHSQWRSAVNVHLFQTSVVAEGRYKFTAVISFPPLTSSMKETFRVFAKAFTAGI